MDHEYDNYKVSSDHSYLYVFMCFSRQDFSKCGTRDSKLMRLSALSYLDIYYMFMTVMWQAYQA